MGGLDGVVLSVVVLGAVHGAEPGHGWPVAAAYALSRPNKWISGLAAGTVLGIGHLVSSLAVVALYFFVAVRVDGSPRWVGPLAGVFLVVLGLREIYNGYTDDHSHGDGIAREHDSTGDEDEAGDHEHDHDIGGAGHDGGPDVEADRGLLGIAGFAFALGFVHEEEFQIIALCAGSDRCLELMVAYAATVLFGIVGLTLALVAGYYRFEERVERLTPYFPYVSGVVLVTMGLGFAVELF